MKFLYTIILCFFLSSLIGQYAISFSGDEGHLFSLTDGDYIDQELITQYKNLILNEEDIVLTSNIDGFENKVKLNLGRLNNYKGNITILESNNDISYDMKFGKDRIRISGSSDISRVTLRIENNKVFIKHSYNDKRIHVILEIGNSYDQWLVQKMGSHENVLDKLFDARSETREIYDRQEISTVFSVPIFMPIPPGTFSEGPLVGGASIGVIWGTKICRETDLALHITGLDTQLGHSNAGQNYCNFSSSTSYDVAVVRGDANAIRTLPFAHELGHIMGAGHETDTDCNDPVNGKGLFMCFNGPVESDQDKWKLSQSNLQAIQLRASDAPCTGEIDDINACDYCNL